MSAKILQFLRAYGRHSPSGLHHRQRAHALILAVLLLSGFKVHQDAIDTHLTHALGVLGTNCSWCSITPY